MSFTRELILPMSKIKNNSHNELLYSNPPNIINLILPTHQRISSIFKLTDKATQKLILTKKGISLKNFNSKRKIPITNPDKILLKSCSGNKNIFEKINYKKKKSNSFCLSSNKEIQNEIINSSHGHVNNKSESFSKIKINKNVKSYCASRNMSYFGNSFELNHVINNINNKSKNKNSNKIIKITKSSAIKLGTNNNNLIPKFKTKINLTSYISNQKNLKLKPRIKITKGKMRENNNSSYRYEKYGNNHINITDKENINLTNVNESNINMNESALISRPRKKPSRKKINLPFSPCANKDEYFRQIKSKKCYIRNEINIPYDKNNNLTRQNSYYNLINHRKQRNKKININTTRDEQNIFTETELFRKNNSMCSFDFSTQNNLNSNLYVNTEYNKEINYDKCNNKNINNNDIKKNNSKNYGYIGVEMNHFRIVKFIQESKSLLLKNGENNL
jgi:hypothetical protein